MANPKPQLEDAIQALQTSDPDAHPSPDLLAAYHARLLAPEPTEHIQEHLVACTACVANLLEMAELESQQGSADGDETADIEAAWQQFETRYLGEAETRPTEPDPSELDQAEGAEPETLPDVGPEKTSDERSEAAPVVAFRSRAEVRVGAQPVRRSWAPILLGAAAVISLGFNVLLLRQPAPIVSPQPITGIRSFHNLAQADTRGDDPLEVVWNASGATVVNIAPEAEVDPAARYRLVLTDPAARRPDTICETEFNTTTQSFIVVFQAGYPPPGSWRLTLERLEEPTWEAVTRWTLEVPERE
ncbi:hypothetical protein SCOR_06220 [Sulfidibacter corallicola]|uniref:Uncharacterized protein n=1 Tax=Sulfidibacter corallicola TaxID=2818388 RepID=A0A8A4TR17_SULCO|nr:hypothetical protein [Sulfidibacter corallicola]QTD51634.1 hypothetical protein J3U87_04120 [Sulfidibacter corallicola]